MKKQRLPLSLGLVLLFVSSFIGAMSMKVNAGSAPSPGVTPDSSSAVGGAFSPAQASPAAPGTGATVGANGQVSVPPAVQANVNSAAASIASNPPAAGTPAGTVLLIILGGSGSSGAAAQVLAVLGSLGVSPASAQALIGALSALFGGSTSASATPGVLVASLKGIAIDTKLAQNSGTPSVDINQLNTAISAYNQIIMESDDEALTKLSQNPEFVEIGNVLKELRAALNAG
ncbi:hypothetical protein [Rivularia sp. UHCC 0363]|uniref:hypothetical protein n=1 Tax=Rivularia sp. UHCC 0363 TaxID=3110244 RepID=UPI002B1FA9D1|nr:hypothetical protein [Rivularia sp. UHCC 0363]MEA5598077.1 hypothetical protein [Rivularia sp. UHCC 0363]